MFPFKLLNGSKTVLILMTLGAGLHARTNTARIVESGCLPRYLSGLPTLATSFG